MKRVTVEGEGAKHLEKGTGIVYRKWVKSQHSLSNGELVEITSERGVKACGLYESKGPVALRILFYHECPDTDVKTVLRERIMLSLKKREKSRLRETKSYRLVNSDGDLFSGLIIDVFGEKVAVLQSSSSAVDRHVEIIAEILRELIGLEAVFEKSTQRSRKDIGLEPRRRWLLGKINPVIVEEGNARFLVDVEQGQKTGFYLDQRFNRLELYRYVSKGDSVLDVFSYTGAFGIHAALVGASKVTFIEEDPVAVALLRKNLELNNIGSYHIVNASIWSIINNESIGSNFDVVVVDPPAFIQRSDRESIRKGIRAYYSSYYWAATRIGSEGILYLSSCSYFLTKEKFIDVVNRSLSNVGVEYAILGSVRGSAPDHVLRGAEYLDYLKGAFIHLIKY